LQFEDSISTVLHLVLNHVGPRRWHGTVTGHGDRLAASRSFPVGLPSNVLRQEYELAVRRLYSYLELVEVELETW